MTNLLPYVGVLSPFDLLKTSLKREALFFDTLAIPNIQSNFFLKPLLTQCPIRSIEYLIESGIVLDPVDKYLGKETYLKKIGKNIYEERLRDIGQRDLTLSEALKKPMNLPSTSTDGSLLDYLSYQWGEAFKRIFMSLEKEIGIPLQKFGLSIMLFKNQLDYDRRALACDLREKHAINAFPIYSSNLILNDDFIKGEDEVVRFALKSVPEPDFETTPWEQILDFRNDSDTKKLLAYFRHWLSEIRKKSLTYRELSEELEYFCHKYEEHIKVQKMKVNRGTLETLLMIPAEMIEGVVHLKPTQAVKALFTFKRQRLALREAEMKAPGRDLAYLIKVREEFELKKTQNIEKCHLTTA